MTHAYHIRQILRATGPARANRRRRNWSRTFLIIAAGQLLLISGFLAGLCF